MEGIPKIKIELEGIRQSVYHLFNNNNTDINDMIAKSLEQTMTEEWVQHKIDCEVKRCIEKAIEGLSGSHELKLFFKDMIIEKITELNNIKEKE